MPALLNKKHELFVLGIARGLPQHQAYSEAGYSTKSMEVASAAATRLLKDVRVQERLAEINHRQSENAATVLTKVWVIEETIAIKDAAKQAGQFGAATRCMELLARETGAFIERKEIGRPGEFEAQSDDELAQFVRDTEREIRASRKGRSGIASTQEPESLH